MHNPVLLPQDLATFAGLVKARKLTESQKTASREKLAGRIKLLHEVIKAGLEKLAEQPAPGDAAKPRP